MTEQPARHGLPSVAVLDTNTVLDLVLFEDSPAQPLRRALIEGRLCWRGTATMRDELKCVLARERLGRWAPVPSAEAVLAFHDRWCMTVATPATRGASVPVCRDSADQMFVDLGLAQQAHWLVSRDKALLALAGRCRASGLQIVTPARWAILNATLE